MSVELSLDVSHLDFSAFSLRSKEELKPNICIYPREQFARQQKDVLRMTQMPLLAIDILSPTQSIDSLTTKIDIYFTLGVKSAWLVVPALDQVMVYSNSTQKKTFILEQHTEIQDEVVGVNLPLDKMLGY